MDAGKAAWGERIMRHLLSPSIMCADISHLASEIRALEDAGSDAFHIDIMDGEFVANFALSWLDVASIRALTSLPLEIHLMVKKAEVHFPFAFKFGADTIYVHFESGNAEKNLRIIKENGKKAGLAINPETSLEDVGKLLKLVNKLLIMRVNPGFASANNVESVEDKIQKALNMEPGFEIVLDGAVGREVIYKWGKERRMGFVLGTRCGLFGENRRGRPYDEIIGGLRN